MPAVKPLSLAYCPAKYVPELMINGVKRKQDFIDIINNNPIKIGNKDDVKKVLELSMVDGKLFTPSLHMGNDDLNRQYSSSIDFRYSDTSVNMLEEHKSVGNKGNGYSITPEEAVQGKGDAHIHITYK